MKATQYTRILCIFLPLVLVINLTLNAQQLNQPTAQKSFFLTSVAGHHGSSKWEMIKADKVKGAGAALSTKPGGEGWLNAVVPGTVLTSLVEDKVYPDPYYGDVNRRANHVIPDMYDAGREFYHYWYRTGFTIPATFANQRIWLKLHGINNKCTVWLNGKKLGNLAGMFITRSFDITTITHLKQNNILAIDVEPVDEPGLSSPSKKYVAPGENSNGGDGNIGKSVTMLMTVGWDFTFRDGMHDRNTGIWRDVEIYATGNVALESPFIYSKLPLPDTTSAKQIISVEVLNATNKPQAGVVKGTIKEAGVSFEKPVKLAANEHKTITFNATEYPQLNIRNPKLWWPINKGAQHLYDLQLSFVQQNEVSDLKTVRFGIREVSSDQNTPDKSRRFYVNGQPIFIRGSNWIPEAMVRNSVTRTHAELKYTQQAGINMLRLWGGGIAESDYFYDLCDEMGILVWNEYWLTANTAFPTDTALYFANMASTIKRERNHAALAYHVSANEGTDIPGAAQLMASIDPSRGYQAESECCGVHDGSPYKYENPMQYFENTASQRGSRIYGFNPEYGSICLPIAESLREMMPAKDLWPINKSVWDYMDGGGFHGVTTKYKKAIDQFGTSSTIEDFAKKAQFVGALSFRAIWEVWDYNKFGFGDRWASGFFFWYHNSPEPQTCSRLYDWSLQPTAALYYSQNGLQPLHPQFDYLKNTVSVYNDYRREFKGYHLSADIYDMAAHKLATQEATVDIPADGLVKDALKLTFPDNISQVHFIKLILKDNTGKTVADAFYWRSKDKYEKAWTLTGPAISGFEDINKLDSVKLSVTSKLEGGKLVVNVSNPSKGLAFFTQLKLQSTKGKSISPAFYSDNFFNLLPGESKTVIISFDKALVSDGALRLVTDAFNSAPQIQTHTMSTK